MLNDMKINSRKFLVFCYAISGRPALYAHLRYLWPEMTPGGMRGLVAHLVKQRLIFVRYAGKQAQLILSPIGKTWVEEEYFSTQAVASQGCIVLIYPHVKLEEARFKSLRKELSVEMTEISVRVYYAQLPLSDGLLSSLKRRYFSYAAVIALKEWLLGDQNILLNYYLQKNNHYDISSSISTQLKELTDKNTSFLPSKHQSNLIIFSLLDRLFDLIEQKQSHSATENTPSLSGGELLSLFSILFEPI